MAQFDSGDAGAMGRDNLVGKDATAGEGAPLCAGVSMHAPFIAEAIERGAGSDVWFEVLPEEFFGGPDASEALQSLAALSGSFPVSLHGVGLGLGAERDLDATHIERLRKLIERVGPCLFSEHLSWSTHEARDGLAELPPPYDAATLDRVSRHIDQTQERLGLQILLENPVQHIRLANSEMEETEFLTEVVARTGCGLLLDINNAFVSAANNQASTAEYLEAFPVAAIGEIHLGGHAEALDAEGRPVLVDCAKTPDVVWTLYEGLIERIGPRPTLIEWEDTAPDWARLEADGARVNEILNRAAFRPGA